MSLLIFQKIAEKRKKVNGKASEEWHSLYLSILKCKEVNKH